MKSKLKLQIEHIRSFASEQSIPIRPITLLVGENSSGKSTFLAIASCVLNPEASPVKPPFNEPPYGLGNYETIATYKAGRYGRNDSFSMGFEFEKSRSLTKRKVTATYCQENGQPILARYQDEEMNRQFTLNIKDRIVSGSLTFSPTQNSPVERIDIGGEKQKDLVLNDHLYDFLQFADLRRTYFPLIIREMQFQRPELRNKLLHTVMFKPPVEPFTETFSFAPIRTKPKRTYDESKEDYSPEGEHIPSLLARYLSEQPLSQAAQLVVDALHEFGQDSGLFRQLEVKKLGKGPADPFQIQVGTGGPKANLVDVGYGISQAMPVIVQSVLRQKRSLLLIQQPEVHLHPRAQAALGTFFAKLAAKGDSTYIIETHSDHLVDRIRQEVANGVPKPQDVQILFFGRPKLETTVYPISLDEMGNVLDAPEQYRRFFLEEEMRLFT